MKENIKKIIILLIILLIICIVTLFIIKRNNAKNVDLADYSNDSKLFEDASEIIVDNSVEYEKNKNIYYTIVSIVNKYITSASINEASTLLDMLDLQYATNYNISQNNIIQISGISPLERNSEYYVFRPNTIYSVDEGKISTHFIYGYYYNISDMENKDISLMVELDNVNQTFNIYNYKYMVDKGYNNLQLGNSYDTSIEEIPNRGNNTFNYLKLSDEDMAKNYLDDYKNIILYNREKAYQLLNTEYSKLKFENLQDFNRFAENKKIDFFKAQLSEYTIRYNKSGSKTYICKDQNGNYYYFEETEGIMIYKVMLDNYTLPDDEFTQKYMSSNAQIKVASNIENFVKSINDKCYYYAYNCLADSFKNNYFKTQAEFETYVKNNFYEINEASYNNFETQGNLYIYSVTIKDSKGDSTKQKTFIVELRDGTDFVLSFEV